MGVNPTKYRTHILRLVLHANRAHPWPATRGGVSPFPPPVPQRHACSPRQPPPTHTPRAPATATADPWPSTLCPKNTHAANLMPVARRVCNGHYLAGMCAATPLLHAPPLAAPHVRPPLLGLTAAHLPDRHHICLPYWAPHQTHATQSQKPVAPRPSMLHSLLLTHVRWEKTQGIPLRKP